MVVESGTASNVHALPVNSEHICAYPARVQWTPEEIVRRRIAHGYNSQESLARALGLSRRAVTNWETGKVTPRGSSLRELERVLGGEPNDNDEDRALRRVSDGRLWAEMQRRYYNALELADQTADQPIDEHPDDDPDVPTRTGGGRYARLPAHLSGDTDVTRPGGATAGQRTERLHSGG